MSVRQHLLLATVAAALLTAIPRPACAQDAGGSYDQWLAHRTATSKDPSVLRYYTFEDVREDGRRVPNLTGKGDDLTFSVVRKAGAPPEKLQVIEGRWPQKPAVRLDQGIFSAKPFDVPERTFTVEAWVRKNGPGAHRGNSEATNGTLLSVGIGYWDGWRLTTTYPLRTIGFELGRPRPINSVGTTTEPVADGVWLHLVGTWDGNEMRVYLNGLLAARRDHSGSYTRPAPEATFRLGYAGSGFGSVILDVDEVAIYDRALSPTEVLARAQFYAPMTEETAQRFEAANERFEDGSFAAAAALYREIADMEGLHPHTAAVAHLRLGEALRERKQLAEAATEFGAVLDTPGLTGAYRKMALDRILQLSRVATGVTMPRGALIRVLELDEVSPADKLNARLNIARSYRNEGDYTAARAEYGKVAELAGIPVRQKLDALLEFAHTCWEAREYASARDAYATIVAAADAPAPYRCDAQLRVAATYVREQAYPAACAAFGVVETIEDAPQHLVWEARERAREAERLQAGLPARDPAWHRVEPPQRPVPAVKLYVATGGSDANRGTEDEPLATLEGARDAIRALKVDGELPGGGVTVYVRGGDYPRPAGFALSEEDSGTPEAPITYSAYPGETVRFTGGVRLTGFAPVADAAILDRLPEEARGKVLSLDLRARGITNYGTLVPRGFGSATVPALEVFVNGKPMWPARWPNEGFLLTGKVQDQGSRAENRGAVFEYEGDRPKRWSQAKDIWMFGYWYHHWADGAIGVANIDPEARLIKTTDASTYGVRGKQRYYFFNLLEELDVPGEWYLDRTAGVLYIYPPSDLAGATVELSMLEAPMVQMDGVSHVTLRGLTFETSRGSGVVINGGTHCLVTGCTLRRLAEHGVVINGGTDHGILGCDIYTLGCNGTKIAGGDRKTLTPGGHFIENCHIHDFSRIDRTYRPAVWMDGVGNRIAHNLIHDSPHHAFRIEGNDHLIEFNEIHSVVYESDDQAGLDMFLNPTYRGNIIRYNYWHHIGSGLDRNGQAGVRLDDAISGVLVYGNVFFRCAGGQFGAVQLHGGKEDVIDNNIFADCKSAISFSPWGKDRWESFLASERLQQELTEVVDIRKPPYSMRYPALARIKEDPDKHMIWRNLVFNCGEFLTRNNGIHDVMDNYVTGNDPGFANADAGDFRLPDDSVLYGRTGFRPIPFEEIGLYEDPLRASWPVTHSITDKYQGPR